jgi:formylglycine-generating enzyme required for sulfatase activity
MPAEPITPLPVRSGAFPELDLLPGWPAYMAWLEQGAPPLPVASGTVAGAAGLPPGAPQDGDLFAATPPLLGATPGTGAPVPVGPRATSATTPQGIYQTAHPGGNQTKPTRTRRELLERFTPFDGAPEFVVLPPGQLRVGAHPLDADAQPHEHPAFMATISQPLAISTTPITFAQWDACLADGGTRYCPGDASWGRGTRPVVNVSWYDAQEYCGWLSRKLGCTVRLPTEAEWEHACWAGQPQEHRFPWGADEGYRQLRHHSRAETQRKVFGTQPVAGLQANPWHLQDLLGHVHQWVQDHYHHDLSATPHDGHQSHRTAYRSAGRVAKGGSWLDSPRNARPSARTRYGPDHRAYTIGFRVVMALEQVA